MTATWNNSNKSVTNFTNQSKNTSFYNGQEKAGQGYFYDELVMFYDQILDVNSGNEVFYDGDGVSVIWLNTNKS